MKRTPLYELHQRLGARLVEFGGWEMPVQYTSIVDEHQAVRTAAGLFDISHMGQVRVTGPGALAFLNCTLTNDLAKLSAGQAQYTLMCNAQGGVIDDLYAYCLARTEYLLVINASRIEVDVAWLERQLAGFARRSEVRLENASDRLGAVAVQGPRTADFIDSCVRGPALRGLKVDHPAQLRKNELAAFSFADAEIFLARTGYTGEDGFEIIAPAAQLEAVWKKVQAAGEPFDLKPAGLGARDTLRTEMGYPLYGHELNENTTPLEAGLGFFVGLEKDDFVGREVLVRQKREGVQRKCAAFKMTGKSPPPRPGYPIWSLDGTPTPVGEVVSGTQSPSLGIGIGMGYLPVELSRPDTAIEIEIRGRRLAAMTVAKPMYRPEQQTV